MSKLTLSPVIEGRENRNWDLTSSHIMPQGQDTACPYVRCGKIFSEPIELTVRAEDSNETYYACPHCFSRVNVPDKIEQSLSKPSIEALRDALRNASKNKEKDDGKNCSNFLGYLKNRPKDSPIPDNCLTCSRILKCM
ncbi:MAG: hypothetical protein PVF15_09785 [Candidatus Bathyarchaeota archaeon]|jgi:DNA-directed RNA polymerase subunit RPC12/RpoP